MLFASAIVTDIFWKLLTFKGHTHSTIAGKSKWEVGRKKERQTITNKRRQNTWKVNGREPTEKSNIWCGYVCQQSTKSIGFAFVCVSNELFDNKSPGRMQATNSRNKRKCAIKRKNPWTSKSTLETLICAGTKRATHAQTELFTYKIRKLLVTLHVTMNTNKGKRFKSLCTWFKFSITIRPNSLSRFLRRWYRFSSIESEPQSIICANCH